MPYKQSKAAAVALCVVVSEAERLIYDRCGAAGLFLSQLRCAAAYLRLRLQLMDDWSGPPTALRGWGWEGREGRQSGGPPVAEHKSTDPRRSVQHTTGRFEHNMAPGILPRHWLEII